MRKLLVACLMFASATAFASVSSIRTSEELSGLTSQGVTVVDFYADWCGTWLECCVALLFLFLRPSHALAPPHSSHLRNSLLRSLLGTAQGRASWWYVSSAPFPLVSPPPQRFNHRPCLPPPPPPTGRPRSSSSSPRSCRR